MISLETAKKLRSAGLKQEPKPGDWVYNEHNGFLFSVDSYIPLRSDIHVLAPRLDQLAEQIEQRGYILDSKQWKDYYTANLYAKMFHMKFFGSIYWGSKRFKAETRDDSLADALLWILAKEVALNVC